MVAITTLGGTAKHIKVAKVGHGLMMMTWVPKPVPDEQAFEAIKSGIDAVHATGALTFLNSAEFYAFPPDITANLALLARFFKKYPGYAEKTFLSIKGGASVAEKRIDASEQNLRQCLDLINKVLDGTKKIDLFECARMDAKISVEDTIKTLEILRKEGKFDHIGLSEVSAATLRRAHAVAPIAAVEIEVSPWSYEEETKKVINAAQELDVAVIAYSPLGRGFLTGQITKASDIPDGDLRKHSPRFQPDVFDHNLTLTSALKGIAQKKNVTPAQLCIAWVSSLGQHVIPLPGSSKADRTLENLKGGDVVLSEDELKEIGSVLETIEVIGGRYPAHVPTWL